MPLPRAANLVGHLPPGAAVWRAMHADGAWTQTDHILADLFDALTDAKGDRRYPRPADTRRRKEHEARAIARALRYRKRRRLRG